MPACVVSPQQTEGPYFIEEGLNRSDIRSNPSNGLVKEGVPLRLVLRVSQVSAGTCTPLEGAVVDVWHCFTSQLYFDDALTDQVRTQAPYNTTGQRPMRNERDFIYQDGGEQLTLQLAPEAAGYTGTFNIGLQMA